MHSVAWLIAAAAGSNSELSTLVTFMMMPLEVELNTLILIIIYKEFKHIH